MADSTNQDTANNVKKEQLSPEDINGTEGLNTPEKDSPGGSYTSNNGGMGRTLERLHPHSASGSDASGGDINANVYQAKVVGDEAVGGLAPTPGQNITDNLQEAAGIPSVEKEPVQTKDKLDRRDDSRWELDPKSSEDYEKHGL
ncbi:MAG: DUF6335 family protein [Halothece sp.]